MIKVLFWVFFCFFVYISSPFLSIQLMSFFLILLVFEQYNTREKKSDKKAKILLIYLAGCSYQVRSTGCVFIDVRNFATDI